MKASFRRCFVPVAIACLAFFSGLNLLAGGSAPGALLQQAYAVLESADHDYKGHRVAAMKQIEAAGALLGVNLKGDGKGREKQAVSDEQLRDAQAMLKQAAAGLTGKAQTHVNNAVRQLSIALSIK